jgi:hypothetical protein
MFSASKSSAPAVSGGLLSKSLRFRSSASASLSRTPSTAGNQQKFTWSGWVKRGSMPSTGVVLFMSTGALYTQYLCFGGTDQTALTTDAICFFSPVTGSTFSVQSAGVYRDPSAWYHIVCAVDTTQATSTNRVRIYVNGSEITYGTSNYPAQNLNTYFNTTYAEYFAVNSGEYFDGYLSDVYFVDGQQLTPSSFGATNATTGQWSPAKYTGTYGTNGFHLTFANATSTTTLGYDTSGNSNNWTTNNISLTAGSTYDSMNDVPVAYSATASNYCVLNPLNYRTSYATAYADGNLKATFSSAVAYQTAYGTFAVSSGKYYWEITVGAVGTQTIIGVSQANYIDDTSRLDRTYTNGGSITGGGSGATYTTNDVIGVAMDIGAGTVTFYKNGTSQGSATLGTLPANGWTPYAYGYNGTVVNANFGQQPFTYTPPSGYVALNTYNLSAPTIAQGNKYMDATTYTGNGSTQSITNAGAFQPDWIWVKERSAVRTHCLTDAVRGFTKYLFSDTTGAEETYSTLVTSVNSNGFNLGASVAVNDSGQTYVAWQWKASNTTAVSNTSGSITSQVSANTTAGFSIVTYTGTGANATVGHGLGVAPSMIIIKCRNASGDIWPVYHVSIGNTQYLRLNGTNGAGTYNEWQNTTPTSSVFYISTDTVLNTNGNTYVAYCFAPIAGYSAFGSYTGNKSTTGPFVYLGFRPKFIMFKNSSSVGGDWSILDTSRSPYNVMNSALQPNGNYAEASNSNYTMNYYSNGFQIGTINDELNSSGGTIVYMAFAENPMKYANAR